MSARTLGWSLAGGVAGLVGVALLYSALALAPMNIISPVTAVMSAVVPVLGGVLLGERPHLLAWVGIGVGLFAVVLISPAADRPPARPGGLAAAGDGGRGRRRVRLVLHLPGPLRP